MPASIQQLHPNYEAQRLSALRRYDILDTPAEKSFDRITAMAARIFGVPIAVISLVDESRIWFKSHHGLNVKEISRDPGLCATAILQNEPWVLCDAREDPRSRDNPLVTSEFGLRFYVGIPLKTQDGFALGMLCVLDYEPHEVSDAQIADLKDLAAVVMDQLELRLSARRAIAGVARLAGERETAMELAGLMARECDHRIKNSLELVCGLLRHQSRTTGDAASSEQLTNAANRVATIGRAHDHISATGDAAVTDAADYLRTLCYELWELVGSDRVHDLALDAMPLQIAPGQLVAIGLIVNELVTNAAKNGARRIKVSLQREAGFYTLSVSDNGPGVPDGFDPAASTGLGMKIVRTQAQRLGGTLSADPIEGGHGARFTVTFPPSA
jgi:two-component sensor histidine kinase